MSSIPIPHSSGLSFLGLPGLPFCHQANLMSGPQSYQPARENDSFTEGEASGNISETCPEGEGGSTRELTWKKCLQMGGVRP